MSRCRSGTLRFKKVAAQVLVTKKKKNLELLLGRCYDNLYGFIDCVRGGLSGFMACIRVVKFTAMHKDFVDIVSVFILVL